jgi:hypothetical protein
MEKKGMGVRVWVLFMTGLLGKRASHRRIAAEVAS